jgi:Ca2+-binding RTX toxin-like protein
LYVYDYDSNAATAQDASPDITPNPNDPNTTFGVTLGALSGGRFAVGDPSHNSPAGAVYVFSPGGAANATQDVDGNLIVTGTGDADDIEIRSAGASSVGVYFDGVLFGTFTLGADDTINISAGGGSDTVAVGGDVLFDANVLGEAGQDEIVAGGGNDYLDGGADADHLTSRNAHDVLLGGLGDDTLLGGNGRDLLIGGDGADSISGDNSEDILIAGSTVHDGTRASLDSIQAIWIGAGSRDARVAALEGSWLQATNLIHDCDVDLLIGGNGTDYFLPDNWAEVSDGTLREAP